MQDVCEALYKIIFLGKIGNIYHISTNQFISIRELCLKILIILKKNPKNFLIKTKDRVGKDMSYKLDSKKLRNNLKWKDKILLEEGLKKTILWCKANLKNFTKKDYLYSHKK
jgi:dTDP-glucose 4,6-dehydratase